MKKILTVLFSLFILISSAQNFVDKFTDFFELELGKESTDSNHYRTKLVLAPIIAFKPSTSLEMGVGSKLLFKFKNAPKSTRTSNFPLTVTYTLRKQIIFWSEYTVFTNAEKYMVKGAINYQRYPFIYYGIGKSTTSNDKLYVDMNNYNLEAVLLSKIKGYFFAGIGFRTNKIWNVVLTDKSENNLINQSKVQLLNTNVKGLIANLLIDSRDNVLNPYSGHFIEYNHGIYGKYIGSQNNFNSIKFDARFYYTQKKRNNDVFAFQVLARFSEGDIPVFEHSALGGKQILRGFQVRRFNEKHAFFTQAEYRWQAFRRFGFVAYSGFGDVYSDISKELSFNTLKYSIGTGIRFKIVPSENLNARLDYAFGFGASNANNFYLGIAESF